MRKHCMRILSVALAVILFMSSGNISAFASVVSENHVPQTQTEEVAATETQLTKEDIAVSDNELEVVGTNSFGRMFAESLEETVCEQEDNQGYNVFSIEMTGIEAYVELEAVEDCILLVAIYDEAGEQLIASGSLDIVAGDEAAITEIDIAEAEMPQYFYLRGYLIEKDTYRPLCTAYESPNYTQEMQEFFAKTTDDFDEDRVLNLDEETDNNFAIYGEDTIVVEENNTNNQFTSIDEEEMIYVVENADTTVTSLAVGDIFVYETEDEIIIIKVSNIEVDGTTATIYGSEASMEEVFAYVKIDGSTTTEEVTVDSTDCGEGVAYQGIVETEDEYDTESVVRTENGTQMKEEVEGEVSTSTKLKYELGEKSPVKGSLNIKLEPTVKYYVTTSYQYIEVKIDYEIGFTVEISDKADLAIPLGKVTFRGIPGVTLEGKLNFVIELDAKLSFTGKLTGKIGMVLSSDEGLKDITSKPKLKTELRGEATCFIGLGFDPSVKVISKKIAKAEIEARVGAEISGEMLIHESDEDTDEKHSCKACIEGEIHGKVSVALKVELLSKWKYTYDVFEYKIKICDWFYSADLDKFGMGKTCPNRSYRVDITVLDLNGNVINNAQVDTGNNYCLSTVNGKTKDYLGKGTHTIKVEKEGYPSESKTVKIKDKPRSIVVYLGTGGGGSSWGDDEGGSGSLGDDNEKDTGAVYEPSEQVQKNNYIDISNYNFYINDVRDSKYSKNFNGNSQRYTMLIYGGAGNCFNTQSMMASLQKMYRYTDMSQVDIYYFDIMGNTSETITDELLTYEDMICASYANTNASPSMNNRMFNECVTAVGLCGKSFSVPLVFYVDRDGIVYEYSTGPITEYNIVKALKMGGMVVDYDTSIKSMSISGNVNYEQSYKILSLVNEERVKAGLPELKMDADLLDAAMQRSAECSVFFSHRRPNGDMCYSACNKMSGENIAITGGSASGEQVAEAVMQGWMESQGHRENILRSNFTSIGIGCFYYDGLWYVTQCFGDNNNINIPSEIPISGTEKFYIFYNEQMVSSIQEESKEIDIKSDLDLITTESITNANVTNISEITGTITYNNLMPNTNYNLYVMKSQSAEDIWSGDNLLYVKQTTSDASGNVSISYHLREDYENAEAFLVCAKQTDLSSATITVKNLTYNGKEQFVKPIVKLNGQTLVEGRDYDLEGDYFAKDAGKYTVTIRGIGMYNGSKNVTYSVVKNTSGNTGGSGGSTSTPSQQSQIEAFVKRMYTVALNREAESAGLKDWSSQLAEQKIDGAGIANGFINSAEFTNRNLSNTDFLDTLYETFFNRPADAGGKAYWLQQLWNGMSRTEVLSGFVNSQEFSNLCDNYGIARGTMQPNGTSIYRPGVRNYVLRMYTKALNRDGETVGVEDWTNRINTGAMSAENVAKSFFSSQEFINRNLSNSAYVETLYQTFMDRPSDASGKQYWINKLNSGMSREQVLEGFSRSAEFSEIMSRYGL